MLLVFGDNDDGKHIVTNQQILPNPTNKKENKLFFDRRKIRYRFID